MILFLFGIGLLVCGYRYYGKFVADVLAPDDRLTPAKARRDGVDYVVLPHWKNMLIQLLNIAGIGPVIGVILGIKFGSIVFLLIPIGNIFGGAVHDFVGGMMSLRNGGANLPSLIRMTLGRTVYVIFACFTVFLLLLVVGVFINIPANLLNSLCVPSQEVVSGQAATSYFWWFVAAIFFYYIIATLFPVDKIIGKIYPFFGMLLLIGSFAIFISLLWCGNNDPAHFMIETAEFKASKLTTPIIPCLFVTIACGIMSGFHATQSPIIARTMASEQQAKSSFYGMMIVEGIIAMIWAGAGMGIYNLTPQLMHENATVVLGKITTFFLSPTMGSITILAVVVLAITSGDTAMRSLRLTLAESIRLPQEKIKNRLIISLPLIAIVIGILIWSNKSAESFEKLWKYFAWGNQVLASMTLIAGTVWLFSQRKNGWITLFPGAFITFVVLTFILWTSEAHGGPAGLGLPLNVAYWIAAALTGMVVVALLIYRHLALRYSFDLRLEKTSTQQTTELTPDVSQESVPLKDAAGSSNGH